MANLGVTLEGMGEAGEAGRKGLSCLFGITLEVFLEKQEVWLYFWFFFLLFKSVYRNGGHFLSFMPAFLVFNIVSAFLGANLC